ncbi:MAG: GNAT family N-acetyltransferase [Candidatus Methanomethylophilaceae archaeon]|nr:GNAT family N-acetyltransferase [Candidatus Methanomethylophilaceae archaeon]
MVPDMQRAFQTSTERAIGRCRDPVLPESDICSTLEKEGWEAYKAEAGGRVVGGALVSVDAARGEGSLDTIYVADGAQGHGIGRALWEAIEPSHPEIALWRTCTPYFDKRNVHFYINVCGFHAVRFCNDHLRDPDGDAWEDGGLGEFFDFEKRVPPRARCED